MTDSSIFEWPEGVTCAGAITFDVDAETVVLSTRADFAARLSTMSQHGYGPTVGLRRVLSLLEQRNVRTTFFVPGFTAERYPDAARAIRDAGHEIGHHGYLHEPVVGMSEEAEESCLLRGFEALEQVTGVRPVGWRAPHWETNYRTPGLLARNGIEYDSSLMDDDCPYIAASEPGGASVVELPVQWALDDYEQYAFIPGFSESLPIESPHKALELWSLELEALAAAGGLFVLTAHPWISGRASRAAALGQLLDRMLAVPGMWIAPLGEIARHVRSLGLEPRVHYPPLPIAQHLAPTGGQPA